MRRWRAPTRRVRGGADGRGRSKSLGVTVEAQYTVGEYDIVILSAKESAGSRPGCARTATGFRRGAAKALAPYIKQDMKFFVAKVNLKEQAKTGFTLPAAAADGLRVAEVHAAHPPRHGERAAGRRTWSSTCSRARAAWRPPTTARCKLPSDMDIPVFVKERVPDVLPAMFETGAREGGQARRLHSSTSGTWAGATRARPTR